jgi:GxxExxY protein
MEKNPIASEQKFLYKELTHAIIGAAMEVHNILGPGFLEAVYDKAFGKELAIRGISFISQAHLQVSYKGSPVGEYIADYFVDEKVIVELKAIKELSDIEEAQLMNYLKVTALKVGLLINFGAASLQYRRRVI